MQFGTDVLYIHHKELKTNIPKIYIHWTCLGSLRSIFSTLLEGKPFHTDKRNAGANARAHYLKSPLIEYLTQVINETEQITMEIKKPYKLAL